MKVDIKRRAAGFTLIELMVAVVIIGVLAAIAYPSYRAYLERGWRTEAKTAIMALAQAQERHFTAFNTYTSNSVDNGSETTARVAPSYSGDNPTNPRYNLAVAGCATGTLSTCYVITATPRWADPLCGNLTFDSMGTRGQSAGTAEQCWNR